MGLKAFLAIIVILFTLFGLVLYIGGNQIYEREAQWQHGNTVARLLSSKEIAGKYFSEFRHNLFFLRDLPSVRGIDDFVDKAPGNIFIQTEEGNILLLRQDGALSLRKSPYIFQDSSGWLYLSEVETIHYSTVEILPGKRFIVALYHSHPLLKAAMLTHEEYEEMKEHVRIGKQVLQDAIDKFKLRQPFLLLGKNICAYHHEKYDGKGYLEGLKGQKIPLEARIFALCDTYDAIRSKRPYKDALTHEEAVRRIVSDSGKHFDPDIVAAFLKIEKEFSQTSETK